MVDYVAIVGDAINWLWSFRDYSTRALSSAYHGNAYPPTELLRRKTEDRILWAFRKRSDFDKLRNQVKEHGELKVVLISNSVHGIVKRGVIGLGRITSDMIVGNIKWDYWPIIPKEQGWDWKFFIEIKYCIPSLMDNIEALRSLSKHDFSSRSLKLTKILTACSSNIITLIPSNVTQGSRFDIKEDEYLLLRELALSKWKLVKTTKTNLKNLDLGSVQEIVDKYGLYYSADVLAAAIAALRSGKHLLLMGAPGTGKSMLARVIAEALGYDLVACTASSTWTRYDFIGGPVLGRGGELVWRHGYLLKALLKHFKLQKESRGAILLVEELNRAEADKVLAEFFTMFPSSNPDEWIFPEGLLREIESYGKDDESKKLIIYLRENNYRIPADFRVIATVNTFDRAYLFTLGYALQRRFVVIEILPPESEEDEIRATIRQLNRKGISNGKLESIVKNTVKLVRTLRSATGRPLGIGLSVDSANLAYEMLKSGYTTDIKEAVEKAASYVILSQLELVQEEAEKILRNIKKEYPIIAREVERHVISGGY